MVRMSKVLNDRFGPVALILILVTVISFLTRLVLLVISWPGVDANPFYLLGIFLVGLFFDLVVGLFTAIPVTIYCWLMKDSWYKTRLGGIPLFILIFIIIFTLVVNAVGEIIFWKEFNVRYNFIAVDYLVYTQEVLGNIWESYNIPLIGAGIMFVVTIIIFFIRKKILASQQCTMRFGKRTVYFLGIMSTTAIGYFFVSNHYKNISRNNYVNELAGNGIYEFGAAFWNNEINYSNFYLVNEDKNNISILRKMLQQTNSVYVDSGLNVDRKITPENMPHKWNVVLISVESLSGDYLKYFGSNQNITPFLDSLIPNSIFFKNFYATGTRTVRGLEALSLAIPPTPGQSIVRRPNNENMFTMGSVLKEKGYDVKFIYGGNSFFDNMGYFFSNNDYQVLDKADIPQKNIHHETVWGVADEDAFTILLQEADKNYKDGKLFFSHLMTVSNHRPYTYPEGRIDIEPRHHLTEGAVKYTDWAINDFILRAKQRPWFDSTLFVIVADHCSKSAGKTDLPVNRYHIPCFIYNEVLVNPKIENRLVSQIDLAPMILGMLNTNYTSRFLGKDIYQTDSSSDRVFISTYEDLGYLKMDSLVILGPKKKSSLYRVDYVSAAVTKLDGNTNLLNEAIAWYNGTSYLIKNGHYKK
ncbi:LTA synthase family protein [Flavobacterium sp.]|uniref:LTA synthase family protein n=1 Tax=Flavobacterium sp. TaxID=239 RepID=UPI003264D497